MSEPWLSVFVGVACLSVINAVVLGGFLRRATKVLERAEGHLSGVVEPQQVGAPPGTSVGAFAVCDLDGNTVASGALLSRPALVLFVAADCEPCRSLVRSLSEVAGPARTLPLYVLCDAHATDELVALTSSGATVLVDHLGEARHAFLNRATPQLFLVDPPGVVRVRRIPSSVADLERLGWQQEEVVIQT